ncbi:hypothetical protein TNCV_1713591 [Trichonephila clavipes]|nr:hypothetical protein TNCV_1713591 [Trichonephila clavipes]
MWTHLNRCPTTTPDEPFYQRALMELQDIQETMAVAVSDIDSFDPCTIPGCPHHEITQLNSPIRQPQNTPVNNSLNVNPCKRKENSNFEYPPQRKTARKLNLDFHDNEEINLSPNKFELPKVKSKILENPGSPPLLSQELKLKITQQSIRPIRAQLKVNSLHPLCSSSKKTLIIKTKWPSLQRNSQKLGPA